MPEGDTVWRTARRLRQALVGAPLILGDLRWGRLATVDLTGALTTDVVSRGKHILHRLDTGLTLHSHLRMEGTWWIEPSSAVTGGMLANPDLRAAVGTKEWTALGRRLGTLDLVRTAEECQLVGHLGPDLLGFDWEPEIASRNLAGSGTSIGVALLDQRNLAGVGTFWASEGLFAHRLGPWVPARDLDSETLRALVTRIQRLMTSSRHHTVQSSTGVLRAGESSCVHGRSGRACRSCGNPVRVAMIGQPPQDRTMFYCPHCQGGLGPTDDGAAQAPLGSRGERSTPRRPRRSSGPAVSGVRPQRQRPPERWERGS